MPFRSLKEKDGLFKSILAAHAILLLHVVLLSGIGFLVFFFSGIVNYMGWIFLAGTGALLALGVRLYRRMKREKKTLYEMLRPSLMSGKSVEVSVMGGLLSFKVGRAESRKAIEARPRNKTPLLEDPGSKQVEALEELVRLLESGLITREEYDRAKKTLFP